MRKQGYHTWACHCGLTYSVLIHDPGAAALPARFKCWKPKCRFYFRQDDELRPGTVISAPALYQAMSGAGVGDEKKCRPADLLKTMVGQKVASISVSQAPDKERSLISSITLENGKTVHLAPSVKGVTVYKVTHG